MSETTDAAVWFYEAFEEEQAELRALLPPWVQAGFSPETLAESGHAHPPAPLISTRTQSVIPRTWFPDVEAVLSRSTGYDHLRSLRDQGFGGDLGYLPVYCHTAVAEHALLATLALLRRLPRQLTQVARFDRDGLTGQEATGRRVAVVGVGHIGAEVARLLGAIGMEVVGVDPVRRHAMPYLEPAEAFAWAEVIVLAMDLNPSSRGWLDRTRLDLLRPGTLLVNVARGELASSSVLLEGLASGRLAGVAVDVYDDERPLAAALRAGSEPSDPEARAALELIRHPDVLATPHNAFNASEALERKARQSVEQAVDWLTGAGFRWSVS